MFSYAALKYVFAKRVLILSLKCIRLLLIFILHVPPSQFFFYIYATSPSQAKLHTAIAQRYNVASEWVENLELSDVEKTSKKSVFCCWLPTTKQQQRTQILPCCCDCSGENSHCVDLSRTACLIDPFFMQVSSNNEWNSHSLSLTFLLLSHCARMTWKVDQSHVTLSCRQKNIFTSVSQKKKHSKLFLKFIYFDIRRRRTSTEMKWKWSRARLWRWKGSKQEKKWKWSQIRTFLTHLRSTQQQRDAFCLWRHLFCFVKMSELHRSPLRVPRRMDGWEKIITFFTQRWWWVRGYVEKKSQINSFSTTQWNWCALHHKCLLNLSSFVLLLCDSVIKSMLLHCWFPIQFRHEWEWAWGSCRVFDTLLEKDQNRIRPRLAGNSDHLFYHPLFNVFSILQHQKGSISNKLCESLSRRRSSFFWKKRRRAQREDENGAQHKNFILWVSFFVCLEIGRFLSFIFYLFLSRVVRIQTRSCCSRRPLAGLRSFFFLCFCVFLCWQDDEGRSDEPEWEQLPVCNLSKCTHNNTALAWQWTGRWNLKRKNLFPLMTIGSHVARVFVVLFAQTTRNCLNLVNEISREEALLTTNESDECEWVRKEREEF